MKRITMKEDKCRELFLKDQGTLKEQHQQLAFVWVNKDAGNHPYFKVSNSKRIKNKRRNNK